MQTPENTEGKLHPANPFHVIPHGPLERVKVWDFELIDLFEGHHGRVRILAVVPKKPEPLKNIKFAVAWCSPQDVKNFSKSKSNKILTGRYLSHFVDGRENHNCGVVAEVPSLNNFQVAVFNVLKNVPNWVKDSTSIKQRTSEIEIHFNERVNEFTAYP